MPGMLSPKPFAYKKDKNRRAPAQPWPDEIFSMADGFLLEHQRNIRMETNCYGPTLIKLLIIQLIWIITSIYSLKNFLRSRQMLWFLSLAGT